MILSVHLSRQVVEWEALVVCILHSMIRCSLEGEDKDVDRARDLIRRCQAERGMILWDRARDPGTICREEDFRVVEGQIREDLVVWVGLDREVQATHLVAEAFCR